MTAPTLPVTDPGAQAVRASTFALSNGFGIKPKHFEKKGDNGKTINVFQGVAVFRSGTFSDSAGYENTWESIHMKQMVDNFNHLRSSGTFGDVPVRDGHPGWLVSGIEGNGKVVGWHTDIRVETMKAPHDGEEYDYLLADYDILDEKAAENIASGLWRNRSAEIGTYLTNNKAENWPVYLGVAYVDIPAVEGLNFSASQPAGGPARQVYIMFDSKEKNVGVTPPAAPQGSTPESAPATAQHGAPAAPAQPFTFSVNGAPVQDFGQVQAHITALESFRSETTKANRESYVEMLAHSNKIPATKLDKFKSSVVKMSGEQFLEFQDLYGDAEPDALISQHATAQNTGTAPTAPAQKAEAAELVILREQVAMHRAAGTSTSAIEKTESYKALIQLDPSFKL
jgi:hypothetical protein